LLFAMAAATQGSGDSVSSNGLAVPLHKERRQSRHKRASDPFLELEGDVVKLPDQPSPNDEKDAHAKGHSLLADLVLTPINMITLILSLFVVDHQQRQWRQSQHTSGSEPLWSRLAHGSWLNPEPYQVSRDTTWQSDRPSTSTHVPDSTFRGWYTRKKHRAMARMELTDALDMRGRVMIALAAWSVLGLCVIAYTMRRLYVWALV